MLQVSKTWKENTLFYLLQPRHSIKQSANASQYEMIGCRSLMKVHMARQCFSQCERWEPSTSKFCTNLTKSLNKHVEYKPNNISNLSLACHNYCLAWSFFSDPTTASTNLTSWHIDLLFLLQHRTLDPVLMAYDRPSAKFLSFLAKHYDLTQSVPQVVYTSCHYSPNY